MKGPAEPGNRKAPARVRFGDPRPHVAHAAGSLLVVAAAWWYSARLNRLDFLASGQWYLGIGAGLGFLSAFVYAARKRLGLLRFRRIRSWYAAHVWLTAAGFVIALFHSQGNLGGPVESTLLAGYGLALASGFGLGAVHVLFRRWMLRVETEHLLPEDIQEIAAERTREIEELLQANRPALGELLGSGVLARLRPPWAALRLLRGPEGRDRLRDSIEAVLKTRGRSLPKEEQEVARRVLDAALERRALGVQMVLHRVRVRWTTAHIVLSTAVLAVLLVHVFLVWYY